MSIPEAPAVLEFADGAEWESWLEAHHHDAPDAWLRIAKRSSRLPGISIEQALASHPGAAGAFAALDRSARYAVILQLLKARTPERRITLLAQAVARLEASAG